MYMKTIFWAIIICKMHFILGCVNDTMSMAKMISDDFRDFQRTGRKVGGRDGRKLVSFITKNDNIEVIPSMWNSWNIHVNYARLCNNVICEICSNCRLYYAKLAFSLYAACMCVVCHQQGCLSNYFDIFLLLCGVWTSVWRGVITNTHIFFNRY